MSMGEITEQVGVLATAVGVSRCICFNNGPARRGQNH